MHSCAEVCRGWFEPCFRPGLLAVALALVLSACGGGGGTKSNPPAATTANPGGFTPTVAVDAGLTSVNPPSVPAQAAAATLPQYSQHLQLTNAAGAIGAGLLGGGQHAVAVAVHAREGVAHPILVFGQRDAAVAVRVHPRQIVAGALHLLGLRRGRQQASQQGGAAVHAGASA